MSFFPRVTFIKRAPAQKNTTGPKPHQLLKTPTPKTRSKTTTQKPQPLNHHKWAKERNKSKNTPGKNIAFVKTDHRLSSQLYTPSPLLNVAKTSNKLVRACAFWGITTSRLLWKLWKTLICYFLLTYSLLSLGLFLQYYHKPGPPCFAQSTILVISPSHLPEKDL